MKKCSECNGRMVEEKAKTPEGVSYKFFKCKKCGEEIVDMKQLHAVAQKYRVMKKYRVKVSQWGVSKGIRIPKELVTKYDIGEEVSIIPEKDGIMIVP